jgi:hypothetical protein
MVVDGPHHIVTDSVTGDSEPRRLLTEKELRFSLEMALMHCAAFSGTPKGLRPERKGWIIESVVKHFALSNVKVFGGVPEIRPMKIGDGSHLDGSHLWDKDDK